MKKFLARALLYKVVFFAVCADGELDSLILTE